MMTAICLSINRLDLLSSRNTSQLTQSLKIKLLSQKGMLVQCWKRRFLKKTFLSNLMTGTFHLEVLQKLHAFFHSIMPSICPDVDDFCSSAINISSNCCVLSPVLFMYCHFLNFHTTGGELLIYWQLLIPVIFLSLMEHQISKKEKNKIMFLT